MGSVPVKAICSLGARILDIFTRAFCEVTETEIYKVKSKKGAFIFHIS